MSGKAKCSLTCNAGELACRCRSGEVLGDSQRVVDVAVSAGLVPFSDLEKVLGRLLDALALPVAPANTSPARPRPAQTRKVTGIALTWDERACPRLLTFQQEGTFCVHTTGLRPQLVVSADGCGVVSHAGSRLLADLADAAGLTGAFGDALCGLRPRGTGHDPGRIAVDLAVMLADGGQAIADLALLRDQPEVFGPVASTPTAWRLLAGIDSDALARLRSARSAAPRGRLAAGSRDQERHPRCPRRRPGPARPGPGHRRHDGHLPCQPAQNRRHRDQRSSADPDRNAEAKVLGEFRPPRLLPARPWSGSKPTSEYPSHR